MHIDITDELAGARLDKLIADRGLGRARARALFEARRVWVHELDGYRRRATKGERAASGMRIEVDIGDDELDTRAVPDPDAPLDVVLETEDLVVIDKPAGQPSAPLEAGERGCAANALLARYPEMASVGYSAREPGLCHRLDVHTSGLLLAARHVRAFDELRRALANDALDKRYLLICAAHALPPGGTIDTPLAPDPSNARRVRACRDADEARRLKAKPALTRYRVRERHGDLALVEARASRAYRHQIRVHFAALGFPLLGDALYGGSDALDTRHALHASHLAFRGSKSLAAFDVESALPAELRALLEANS